MAAHFRKTIRDKAAELLTGLTTTGSRVFSGRTRPLSESDIGAGALVIVPGPENAGYGGSHSDGGMTIDRNFMLIVIAEVMGNDGLFDDLDTIAGEVETALANPAHKDLDGLALAVEPPSVEYRLSDDDGRSDKRRAQLRMSFPVTYITEPFDPTSQA